ncbi:S24 family peptidase [Bradyrhizobium sp. LHD-71]|uniref:S24 family peptidase n=1 Tax=Bradyrhizobium sp. LHD-71 TaxID=3072141 RepID=UPI00280D34EC|nr:S24 family peptidase [Bradyrhizobium sp. LHD-71]MDQ8729434.1 S24 family peptidase [Bradyrhizobium sp. LHD-71]
MITPKQMIDALKRTGKSKGGLATHLGLRNSAITEILAGDRNIRANELPLIVEYLELDRVPIMGRVGAGGDIEPDYEQVVADDLGTVRVPIALPGELIAFEVKGESMMPRYDSGDIVVVWAEQKRATETFYGEEATVRTKDGRRYLKTITQGRTRAVATLTSWNAKPIENVKLEWIGEIYLVIRAGQIARIANRKPAKVARRR